MSELNTADKVAMYVGGGLVVLGVLVIGLLDMFLGAGHPVTGEGQIVHEALVPMDIRAGIILLGFVIWALYAVYKVVGTTPKTEPAGATDPDTAD
ncbi:hypothetical protein ACKVMT_00255 [Halobacteriales archaeon Cl-PHB]